MSRHISEEYDAELGSVQRLLMEMGGLVEEQVRKACRAFVNHDALLAAEVRSADDRINAMEVELDELCINIIARRQPAASDLRMLISIMNASTDLERVGDEANRIAKMAREVADLELPGDQYSDFRDAATMTADILAAALDAFARKDTASAVTVIESDQAIDKAYKAIVRTRGLSLTEAPEDVDRTLNILWSARSLERIGDHSKNIGEYVVYLVKGKDVRHSNAAAAVSED